MKCVALKQPWAWACIHAGKGIENRSWKPGPAANPYRGPLAILASKGYDTDGHRWIEDHLHISVPKNLPRGGLVGRVDLVDVVTHSDSPWFFGPQGWVLSNPQPIAFVPFKGRLGLFEVPDELVQPLPQHVEEDRAMSEPLLFPTQDDMLSDGLEEAISQATDQGLPIYTARMGLYNEPDDPEPVQKCRVFVAAKTEAQAGRQLIAYCKQLAPDPDWITPRALTQPEVISMEEARSTLHRIETARATGKKIIHAVWLAEGDVPRAAQILGLDEEALLSIPADLAEIAFTGRSEDWDPDESRRVLQSLGIELAADEPDRDEPSSPSP